MGPAVQSDTGNAADREFDGQDVTLFPGREVAWRTMDGAHFAVGKGLGVELGSSLGIFVVPEADRVLCHGVSFRS
jgi:hypothetical protein